jgi:hypothetical protein
MTRTIDARWAELAPGTVAPLAQHHTRLSSPLDVLWLVEQLAQPHTSEAYLIHADRPHVTSTVTGRTKADHGLVIAVHDGRGYAEYSDRRRHCQTLGDPDSGEWHTTPSRSLPARQRNPRRPARGDGDRVPQHS